jgi:hypothetical protein
MMRKISGPKRKEVRNECGEIAFIRSFIICTLHKILFG